MRILKEETGTSFVMNEVIMIKKMIGAEDKTGTTFF